MGRNTIPIKKIDDDQKRRDTFRKRKEGLMKKAMELSILCESEVHLIIFSEQGKLHEYCSSSPRELLEKYMKAAALPHTTKTNHDYTKFEKKKERQQEKGVKRQREEEEEEEEIEEEEEEELPYDPGYAQTYSSELNYASPPMSTHLVSPPTATESSTDVQFPTPVNATGEPQRKKPRPSPLALRGSGHQDSQLMPQMPTDSPAFSIGMSPIDFKLPTPGGGPFQGIGDFKTPDFNSYSPS